MISPKLRRVQSIRTLAINVFKEEEEEDSGRQDEDEVGKDVFRQTE